MTISFDNPSRSGRAVSGQRYAGLTMAGLAAYVILIVLVMIYFGLR